MARVILNPYNQDIDRVTIYFKDGRRVEFTDIGRLTFCAEPSDLIMPSFSIELERAKMCTYEKRTSKRYVKNRRGWRK